MKVKVKTIQVVELDSANADRSLKCIQEVQNVPETKVKAVVEALVQNYNPDRFIIRVVE